MVQHITKVSSKNTCDESKLVEIAKNIHNNANTIIKKINIYQDQPNNNKYSINIAVGMAWELHEKAKQSKKFNKIEKTIEKMGYALYVPNKVDGCIFTLAALFSGIIAKGRAAEANRVLGGRFR